MLVEARGRAESRRACADDEDADLLKKIEENLKRGKKSASREVEEVENLRDRLDGARSDLCSLSLSLPLSLYLPRSRNPTRLLRDIAAVASHLESKGERRSKSEEKSNRRRQDGCFCFFRSFGLSLGEASKEK